MMVILSKKFLSFLGFLFLISGLNAANAASISEKLDQAIAGAQRTPAYAERDQFRHPKETLLFFGLEANQSVVEITPGGGWYTEILAPVLKDNGVYYPASYKLHDEIHPYFVGVDERFAKKLAADPASYDRVRWVHFDPNNPEFAPDGPVDMVLTFRNVHNWAKAHTAEWMFDGFARALKMGGILGVVEHRAKPGTSIDDQIKSGYMTVEYVVALAEEAGFQLIDSSEVNANAKDTKDYPGGVWNLLPNLRNVAEEDKARMAAIGESDRMTLKFKKVR